MTRVDTTTKPHTSPPVKQTTEQKRSLPKPPPLPTNTSHRYVASTNSNNPEIATFQTLISELMPPDQQLLIHATFR